MSSVSSTRQQWSSSEPTENTGKETATVDRLRSNVGPQWPFRAATEDTNRLVFILIFTKSLVLLHKTTTQRSHCCTEAFPSEERKPERRRVGQRGARTSDPWRTDSQDPGWLDKNRVTDVSKRRYSRRTNSNCLFWLYRNVQLLLPSKD